jgi:uncharacterized membrane protein
MTLLVTGLILFFGAHLSPGVFGLRTRLVAALGENRFRGLYIATSVTGMVCLITGKSIAPYVSVYFPPIWARPVSTVLMAAAFILLAALLIPSNFRHFTRHPMLWAMTLWSAAHLLANGDLTSILVFGCFGLYALVSMWSLNARGAALDTTRYAPIRDLLVVTTGLLAFACIAWLHPVLFGVPAILSPAILW